MEKPKWGKSEGLTTILHLYFMCILCFQIVVFVLCIYHIGMYLVLLRLIV